MKPIDVTRTQLSQKNQSVVNGREIKYSANICRNDDSLQLHCKMVSVMFMYGFKGFLPKM